MYSLIPALAITAILLIQRTLWRMETVSSSNIFLVLFLELTSIGCLYATFQVIQEMIAKMMKLT